MKKARYIAMIIAWHMAIGGGVAQPFFEVDRLPFSTSFCNEIAAVPCRDGLIYCSDCKTNVLVNHIDFGNKPLYRLYLVQATDSMKWKTPHAFRGLPVDAHQGPCSVNANGSEIYYTLNRREVNGIYSARRAGDQWGAVRPFEYNSPDYRTAHPSLSNDDKRIFFASDMPGGYGGFDIYCCEKTSSGWGSPKNLGPEVNTDKDELYPFIHASGTLYFSSYGHESMGGLDIFSVSETGGTWGTRLQMEAPLNSAYDDFAFTLDPADDMKGYFSSNRNGQSCDLFSFRSLFPTFETCSPQEENDYTYEFFDPGTTTAPDAATFGYEWVLSDGTVKIGETIEHTFASTGRYTVILNIVDLLTGKVSEQVAAYELDVLDVEQPYITAGGELSAGIPVQFDASKTYLPALDIDGYYWIFGDGTRTGGERVQHVFVAPGTYPVLLGVTGKSKETGKTVKVCSSIEITVK